MNEFPSKSEFSNGDGQQQKKKRHFIEEYGKKACSYLSLSLCVCVFFYNSSNLFLFTNKNAKKTNIFPVAWVLVRWFINIATELPIDRNVYVIPFNDKIEIVRNDEIFFSYCPFFCATPHHMASLCWESNKKKNKRCAAFLSTKPQMFRIKLDTFWGFFSSSEFKLNFLFLPWFLYVWVWSRCE